MLNNRILRFSTLCVITTLFLASCGGGSHHKGGGDEPDEPLLLENGDLMSGKPYVVKIPGAQLIEASKGTVSKVNPVTGEEGGDDVWFFTLPADYYAAYNVTYDELKNLNVVFRVTDRKGNITEYERNIPIEDAYLMDQWHLYNIGQNPFYVTTPPSPKIDLNVIPAWRNIVDRDGKKSLTDGTGVKIAVFDTAVDFANADLKERIYNPEGADPRFVNIPFKYEWLEENAEVNTHGTEVSGIIAASGVNGDGVRGIAFNAEITSFSVGDMDDPDDDDYTFLDDSLQFVISHPEYRIINASFGDETFSNLPDREELLNQLYKNGTALIHAIGNSFESDDLEEFLDDLKLPVKFAKKLNTCEEYSSDCIFMLTDSMARHPYTINVGAMTASGKKSSYSSTGPGLWISGFGGEYGYVRGQSEDDPSEAALVTTRTGQENFPEGEEEELREDLTPWRVTGPDDKKYYTASMNGTSSAAPTVTGVVALANQVKPDITISQLRYILATTARNHTVLESMAYDPVEVEIHNGYWKAADPGWIQNNSAEKLYFSNFLGFGLVDAAAVVEKAATCSNDPACSQLAGTPDHYVSANDSPCEQIGSGDVFCVLRNFYQVDENGNRNGELSAPVIIDAVTVDLKNLIYSVPQTDKKCRGLENLPAKDEQDPAVIEKYRKLVLLANNNMQIDIFYSSGTSGVIKPYYSNWSLNYDIDETKFESAPDRKADIPVSLLYREELTDEDTIIVSITSRCEIDVDYLNKGINADVYTYPKF